MPPPSKLQLLPPDVRSHLHRRVVELAFSGYDQLADWLTTIGYPVSKSALGAYTLANRGRIMQEACGQQNEAADTPQLGALVRALAVLAACIDGDDDRNALARADEFLAWIYGP